MSDASNVTIDEPLNATAKEPNATAEVPNATAKEPNATTKEPNATVEIPNITAEGANAVPNATDEEPYNTRFSKGEHVILELRTGDIFEGNYAGGSGDRVDLINTKQYNNENVLGGVYSFYRNEIEDVYILRATSSTEKLGPVKIEIMTGIEREEYYRLEKMAKEYVYIDRADDRYYKAIKKMHHVETIGIAPIGLEPGRNTQIKLLGISTWNEVYLFDFMEHRRRYFYPELKEILELKYVTKVFHRGSPLVDLLNREYNITMQKTFDTEIADIIIQKGIAGECPDDARDLSECIHYYLGLPTHLVMNALEPNRKWDYRPLSDDCKLYAAQFVTYLIILKKQMEKLLLSDTYNTINKVLEFYINLEDPEVYSECCRTDIVPNEVRMLIPCLKRLSSRLQLKGVGREVDSFGDSFHETNEHETNEDKTDKGKTDKGETDDGETDEGEINEGETSTQKDHQQAQTSKNNGTSLE